MTTLYVHNLGCSKNQVEGELLRGWGCKRGLSITTEPLEADTVIVNTCAFIQEAQEEAIDAILDAGRLKIEGRCQKLFVCGCFPQRFQQELAAELPEVDAFFGVGQWQEILNLIAPDGQDEAITRPYLQRDLQTPDHYAYLRIADGCNRGCAYCVIPALRGSYVSRSPDDLIAEAEYLARRGVKELLPVAQELNSYGHDLGLGSGNQPLISLLDGLCRIEDFAWIRPLYLHPPACDEKLFSFWAGQTRLCRYLDLPLEHVSGRVLRAMGRGGDRRQLRRLIDSARKYMPDVVLRTSLIVGFPGETEADFQELLDFVQEVRFQHLGVFEFSAEEGTRASQLPQQVPAKVRRNRHEQLMEIQREVAFEYNLARVGEVADIFIDSFESESGYSVGHGCRELPELDGEILVAGDYPAGTRLKVRIESAQEYDLLAVPV